MLPSVDSIALVRSYRHRPPDEELTALGWVKKKGKRNTEIWICNGLKGTNEPRLTFYETWEKAFRLRVDLSIPKLLFGANVQLPNDDEIQESLEIISNNVGMRTGFDFDAFTAQMARADYAANWMLDYKQVKSAIRRYRDFQISRLVRHTIGDETVYFTNKSRTIRIYDKRAEVCAKRMGLDIQAQSKGIVRIEYSLLNADSIRSFAERLGFKNITAGEILSRKNIRAAHRELNELLKINSINLSEERKLKLAFDLTQDIKPAMRLAGFIEAIDCFGEDFYRDNNFKMSKSTYDRNLRECQDSGLI